MLETLSTPVVLQPTAHLSVRGTLRVLKCIAKYHPSSGPCLIGEVVWVQHTEGKNRKMGEYCNTLLDWFLVVMVTHRLTWHLFPAASWTFDLIILLRFRSSLLRPLVPEPLGSLLV